MADEPQVPAQPEGASQPTKKKAAPVNLAMVEAAERGIDLDPKPAPKEKPKTSAAATPPSAPEPAPAPVPAEEAAPAAEAFPSTSTPAEEPGREAPSSDAPSSEAPVADSAEDTSAGDTLADLAEAATKKRLSPRDEDRATALLRTSISTGQAAEALAAMPKLPWILGVRAIEQAWPQLAPEQRTQLLEQLASFESEHAIRLRLSVARSLAKIDPPVGVELAGSVCRAMWDAEKGALSSDHSKLVGNVFIGRGKPWVIQLPLEGLQPPEAEAIVAAVLFSAFNVNNPPITQLSILRYSAAHLGQMHPNLLAMVARGVSRWSGKWQDSLRKEVPNLPEALSSALKPARAGAAAEKGGTEAPAAESAEGAAGTEAEDGELPLPPNLDEKLKLAVESGDAEAVAAVTLEVNAWRDAQAAAKRESAEARPAREEPAEEPERRGEKRKRGRDRDRERERNERPSDRKERPVYVSREQEAAAKGASGPFNLSAVLKQIESQFTQLRNELGTTQAKLRKAEAGATRRPADKIMLSVEEANLSPDELKRLVLQLERRNSELQARVEELLSDSETRALATAADADVTAQYRTLLKLKLQEDYSDYLALEKNLPEYVVQQHYRGLIRHVFGVLREEGVGLEGDLPPPPPEPLPPPPPPPVIEDDEEDDEESALDQLDAEPDSEPAEVQSVDDTEDSEGGEPLAEGGEEAAPELGDSEPVSETEEPVNGESGESESAEEESASAEATPEAPSEEPPANIDEEPPKAR